MILLNKRDYPKKEIVRVQIKLCECGWEKISISSAF